MLSNNLVYVYEINTNKWQQIAPNIAVPKVDSHSAVKVEGKMFVYGGYIPEKANYMTDMYSFDFEQQKWEVVYKGGQNNNEPEGRSDFDMVLHDGSIWLFGGSNGKVTLSDFWRFDLKEFKWYKIEAKNCPEVFIRQYRGAVDTQ